MLTILKVEATRTVRNWESFMRKKLHVETRFLGVLPSWGGNEEGLALVSFDSRSQELCG